MTYLPADAVERVCVRARMFVVLGLTKGRLGFQGLGRRCSRIGLGRQSTEYHATKNHNSFNIRRRPLLAHTIHAMLTFWSLQQSEALIQTPESRAVSTRTLTKRNPPNYRSKNSGVHTVGSNLEHGSRMIDVGIASFFGLGLVNGHVSTLWLPL